MHFPKLKTVAPSLFCLVLIASANASDIPRKWTNSIGIHMEATLMSVEGSKVTLLLDNSRSIVMDIDKLSSADQIYVHEWQLKQNIAAQVIAPTPADQSTPAPEPTPFTAQTPAQPAPAQMALQTGTHAGPSVTRPHPIGPPDALMQAMQKKGLTPDPRVQPKAELYLTFPTLGQGRSENEPMAMHIRIPEHYSPDRPVPLFVWLSGGDGSSRFNELLQLVNHEDFVLVGMNYPLSVPKPQYIASKGEIAPLWEIQNKMVARLLEIIPNLDPKLRIIGGFSNGAHTIGACLSQNQVSFYKFFNVFVLIEGGDTDVYNYPPLPGRYFYFAWGNGKGGDGDEFGALITNAAKRAQMNVEAHPMVGIGHDFPQSEEQRLKRWIYDVVLPGTRGY